MKTIVNQHIRSIIEVGTYVPMVYNEEIKHYQNRVKPNEYCYSITTADNILHVYSKEKTFAIPIKDFDWRMLWDKLGDIPVNDNDELEERFEHFEAGADRIDVWRWFEWFFDITLGDEIYK